MKIENMKINNNKGVTLMGLIITIISMLIVAGIVLANLKDNLNLKDVNSLRNDMELLSTKVDDYYLKYDSLPVLCNYTNKLTFTSIINSSIGNNSIELSENINPNDGDSYAVIDLEKLGDFALKNGYENNGEYFQIKSRGAIGNPIEKNVFVINTTTHQIYYPQGVIFKDVLYITF